MTAIGQKKSTSTKEDFIKSIDDLFLKIELAYHYQFYKVFGTDEKLKEGKKLWAISLKNRTPDEIHDAIEYVILNQSYLPTLTDIMKACEEVKKQDGYPTPEEAYIEARKSYQPRKNFNWSHPFVYHAGAKVGWYRLKTESEFDIKKEFLEAYEEILDESEFKENLLLLPEIKEEFTEEKPLSSDLQKLRLEKIKKK